MFRDGAKSHLSAREMSTTERTVMAVMVPGPEGALECLWSDPGSGQPAAILCHPHPAHGGSMHSKVVHTLHRVLHAAGHPTIRFNFRGVGASTGSYSGWDAEVGDVAAVAAYARDQTARATVWLVGFSFGSRVGLKWALQDGGAERVIVLGVSAGRGPDDQSFDFLDRPPAPMLIVQGENDRYGSPEEVHSLQSRLRLRGDVEVRFVAGADHFFTNRLPQLAAALRDGLGLEKK